MIEGMMTTNPRATSPNHSSGSGESPIDAIVTTDLVRHFGDVQAVKGVNIQIPKGEIYGFLGPNGAGKSTTIHMLCTLLAPSGGRATVAGFDVEQTPERFDFESAWPSKKRPSIPKQTGTELLSLQGRLYGLRRREIQRRVSELAELIDLGDFLGRMVGTYSGGMKRRLDLAAALIHNPEIVFLDEPTTGLDPVSRLQVWTEVRRINEELGITIFLTTQYLEEADELAHRVGIIDHGQIVAEGTPSDLKKAVGSDLILVRVEGDTTEAMTVLANVPGVQSVEAHRGTNWSLRRAPVRRPSAPSRWRSPGPASSCAISLFERPRWMTCFSNSPVPTSNAQNLRRIPHDHCR